jgi:hypothetical protein
MPREALKNREAGLWRLISDGLKTTGRKIETSRLESWALPGLPDVLLCSEHGDFSFIELKYTKARAGKVDLSAHQCAWLTRHSHSNSYVVLRDRSLDINVFAAADAVDLRLGDFTSVPALGVYKAPYDWDEFFELTCPL